MANKVTYKQTENKLPYPRVEWKCECGFRLALMQGYNPDWNSDDYGKLVHPSGKCMKCNGEISVG